MTITVAFDIYGTLIDPHGVAAQLGPFLGNRAAEFSLCWREKQLEYSFRRGLMKQYCGFSKCTAQALDYCCEKFNCHLSDHEKQKLLNAYQVLPAFADVKPALERLQQHNIRMLGFSNGELAVVEHLLETAGIRQLLSGVVSVETVQSFKPDPAVYQHFVERAGVSVDQCWLVSSNPFDITGAKACGWRTLWLQRSAAINFDPWELQPDITLPGLQQLAGETFQI